MAYRLAKRKAAGRIGDLTGRPISEGSVVACERAVSQAVAAPVAQVRACVKQQPSGNVDETSWRQKGKGWLWVAVTPLVAVFLIHLRRSREAAKALLEEVRLLFDWGRRLKEGKIERATFKRYVAPLKERVLDLLSQGAACRQPKTTGTCREPLDLFPALWTFVYVEGIEPANNAAELPHQARCFPTTTAAERARKGP